MKTKPSWVEALDSAKIAVANAANAGTPEEMDAKTRIAYCWLDIARLLKDTPE